MIGHLQLGTATVIAIAMSVFPANGHASDAVMETAEPDTETQADPLAETDTL